MKDTKCLSKLSHWSVELLLFFLNFWILYYLFFYTAGSYQLSILYILVYICQSQSPNSSHHPTPCHFPQLVSIHLFSTSMSQFLPCKTVHLYHFSRFHIYALIYDICFSLSDLLHSVWQSLDPSTSLQWLNFFPFSGWVIFHLYICTTSSLSIRLSVGI